MKIPLRLALLSVVAGSLAAACSYSGPHGPDYIILQMDDGSGGAPTMVRNGTVTRLETINPDGHSWPHGYLLNGGKVYFMAYDGEANSLYATGGGNTVRLAGIYPSGHASAGNKIVFAGLGEGGFELWGTDSTPETTAIIKDLHPGGSSSPHNFTGFGDKVIFTAYDPDRGDELWVTDGTESGTRLVKDIRPGPASSNPYGLTKAGGLLYFAAETDEEGFELWVTDGTEAGTRMVRDIWPGESWSQIGAMRAYGGRVYFTAEDGEHGSELWTSGGTPETTYMLKDIAREGGSNPGGFAELGGSLYFSAQGQARRELWVTDGTPEMTRLVKDVHCYALAAHGDKLFFAGNYDQPGEELWVSDGTPEGTRLVADLNPDGANAIVPVRLLADGSFQAQAFYGSGVPDFYFVAVTDEGGMELWVSDGTPEGTRMVVDYLAGAGNGIVLD